MGINSLNFDGVLLQNEPVRQLRTSLSKNRISQTYLFLGPTSIGKQRVAKAFASAIECLNPQQCEGGLWDSCEKCLSCRRILLDTHPDVTFLNPIGTEIRVDQIRKMQEIAFLNPFLGKWRIFIIDPADRLNEFSSNCLLKILEEAPSRVVFILLAQNPDRIFSTIKSRATPIFFCSPPHHSARSQLEAVVQSSPDEISKVYAACDGQFGKSLKWLLAPQVPQEPSQMNLGETQVWYFSEFEKVGSALHSLVAQSPNLESAFKTLLDHQNASPFSLLLARKAFTRGLVMAPALPAGFPILFTKYFFEKIDQLKRQIQREVSDLLASQKNSFSSALLKSMGEQLKQTIDDLGNSQISDLIQSLIHWYADIFRFVHTQDVTLLLNLDHKEDIIAISKSQRVTSNKECLQTCLQTMEFFHHHVNRSITLENMLMNIGGLPS